MSRAPQTALRRARAQGVSPQEFAYDTLLQQDGRQLLFVPVASYN